MAYRRAVHHLRLGQIAAEVLLHYPPRQDGLSPALVLINITLTDSPAVPAPAGTIVLRRDDLTWSVFTDGQHWPRAVHATLCCTHLELPTGDIPLALGCRSNWCRTSVARLHVSRELLKSTAGGYSFYNLRQAYGTTRSTATAC